MRIQWGQGVASRGKLTGKTLPVLEPASSSQSTFRDRDSPQSVTPGESSDSRDDLTPSSNLVTSEPTGALSPMRHVFQPIYSEHAFQNKFALNLDLSYYTLPDYLQDKPVLPLIRYYDNVVASVMPWVDGPDNPWRTLLLPLAMQSPSLLLAVLALSAEHYCSRSGSKWPADTGLVSSVYRDRSLQLLAQDMRTQIGEDSTMARQAPASSMLATILTLCNLEMIHMESVIWRVHWKAARTISRHWMAPAIAPTELDATCRFLLRQAFVYDVFGASTTFDGDTHLLSSAYNEEDTEAFADWLELIQEVTRAERIRNDTFSREHFSTPLANMHVLQERFEYARTRSLQLSKTMDFGSPRIHGDFTILIDIFHYAGLVYSFQALLDPMECVSARDTCINEVIRSIGMIENKDAFQHDLVWPLFIIGSESRHNPGRQQFAQANLLEAIHSTGFSNCYPGLEFLQRFWATDPRVAVNWLQFARQESSRGFHFLVI